MTRTENSAHDLSKDYAAYVSIIIVNWKTPKLLADCLDSLKADQQFSRFETIVVDNNSGDESVPMLKERYPDVKLIENADNKGFSKAVNQAIPLCRGRYVLLLNPDAKVVGDAVSTLAKYLDDNPKAGACGPKVLNADGTLQLACRRAFPSVMASFYRLTYLSHLFPKNEAIAKYNMTFADPDELLEVDALSGSCMMVRSQVVDQIGLLDEDIFMFGEDIDWCWRVKEAGYSVVYVPAAVVYHIHGASSRKRPVGTTINLHKGMEVFYRKHHAKRYWPPFNLLVYAAIWSRALLFILINVARGAFQEKELPPSETKSPPDADQSAGKDRKLPP
ncbi:MAG: glycosyltransferase [Cyanobacteria bacterium SZAS TMP-1]|nr:glycosyltransferase [Cyanobacteria bacterium SZAS TMP-1]